MTDFAQSEATKLPVESPTSKPEDKMCCDRQLVARSLTNDPEARDEISQRMICIHRYLQKALSLRWVSSPHGLGASSIEDLEQETMLRAWQRRASFDGTSTLETWLIGIARNVLIESRRKRASELQRRTDQGDHSLNEHASSDPSPATEASDHLTVESIQSELDALSQRDQDLIRAKLFEGHTFRQLSLQLDVASSTLKKRYYTAMDTLKQRCGHAGNANRKDSHI